MNLFCNVSNGMTANKWDKAKEIFTAALDCDEQSQGAFVAAACGEDEELRREVSSLLAAFAKADNFIENPAVTDALKVVDEQKHRAIAGRRIGHYTLIREVGQGGMGVVYLATRADAEYDKQVVIKLIRGGMDSEDI